MKRLRLGLPLLVFGLALFFVSGHALAATYTVDSIGDGANVGPGCNDGTSHCTLRAAIEAANANAGADTINFNIAGAGVHTFAPASAYPDIVDQVTIDGTSQPGASCGTLVPANLPAASNTSHTLKIEIRGDSIVSGSNNLLSLTTSTNAAGSTVKGLILNRANGYGSALAIDGSGGAINNVTFDCNYIGTDQTGMVAESSGDTTTGVAVQTYQANQLTISNNLISGGWGVPLNLNSDDQFTAHGNLIGTTVDGKTALANNSPSYMYSFDSLSHFSHNIVSGNNAAGLSPQALIQIEDNYIGVGLDGNPLGNGGDGIYMNSLVAGMIVGSTSSHNVISANSGAGIHIVRLSNCESIPSDSTIIGNYIGANTAGKNQAGFGNHGPGIMAHEMKNGCGGSVYRHRIGGDAAGEPNVITGNTGDGIQIFSVPWSQCDDGLGGTFACGGTDVFSISSISNSIYSNGGMMIDLAADSNGSGAPDGDIGPNPINNFPIDYPSSYANNYLNHPVVNSAKFAGNQLTVNYDFTANPVSSSDTASMAPEDLVGYRLDFYANDGKDHIGSFIIDGSAANASHTFTSPVTLSTNMHLSVTATTVWKILPPGSGCVVVKSGVGPPYGTSGGCF